MLLAFVQWIIGLGLQLLGFIVWRCDRSPFGSALLVALALWLLWRGARRWRGAFRRLRSAVIAGAFAFPLALFLLTLAVVSHRRIPEPAEPVSWNPATRVFTWHAGQVTLPPGFSHERQTGIDTTVGEFHAPGGRVSIRYDIGEVAGEHGLGTGCGFKESLVGGARVRTVQMTADGQTIAVAWFPDSGCANFYLHSPSTQDAASTAWPSVSVRDPTVCPSGSVRCSPGSFARAAAVSDATDLRYTLLWPRPGLCSPQH